MNQYRFYSRKQGWSNSEYCSKFYNTGIIFLDKYIGSKIVGQIGKEILKNNNINNKKLLQYAKIYYDWYFYNSSINIGCSTEYYI